MKKLPKPLVQAINRLAMEITRTDYDRVRRDIDAEARASIAQGVPPATVRENLEQRVSGVILEAAVRQTRAFLNRNVTAATALRTQASPRARERERVDSVDADSDAVLGGGRKP